MRRRSFGVIVASLLWVSAGINTCAFAEPPHSNIFVEGDMVRIHVPESLQDDAAQWRILDETLELVAQGALNDPTSFLPGDLPLGWYRVELLDQGGAAVGFTTTAVLAPLVEPAGPNTPVCVDVALSWLADDAKEWAELTRLASLANVGMVRDRIRWREIEPSAGAFMADTKYDVTAQIQHSSGIEILQVFHDYPNWSRDASWPRIRVDLRHVYRFGRKMTERFKGRVHAWQPWNEGNASNFGGYTIDELASHQKAAYLGFKAGDPDIEVGWVPIGGIDTIRQANAILKNVTWPYYDIYSLHTYDWAHAYDSLWGPAREAAAGRRIWVSESDRGMNSDPDSPVNDYTHSDDLLKAEYIPQSYVLSYFAGAERNFHFILGPYTEGSTAAIQFGLLRYDYTPRISYVAMAAVGRFLANAEMSGRWNSGNNNVYVYAFRARPDGVSRDVIVAWTERETGWANRGQERAAWMLPGSLNIETIYDYLGRELGATPPAELTSAPLFLILPEGATDSLQLTPPRNTGAFLEGEASSVVFQLATPGLNPEIRQRAWTSEPERVFQANATVNAELTVYNFGEDTVSGTVDIVESPNGWTFTEDSWQVELAPMERQVLSLVMTVPSQAPGDDEWVVFEGDFGDAGEPTLAFQAFGPNP